MKQSKMAIVHLKSFKITRQCPADFSSRNTRLWRNMRFTEYAAA